jgi:hypothetical protein
MTRPVVTIGPVTLVEEAAQLMVKEKIGALGSYSHHVCNAWPVSRMIAG